MSTDDHRDLTVEMPCRPRLSEAAGAVDRHVMLKALRLDNSVTEARNRIARYSKEAVSRSAFYRDSAMSLSERMAKLVEGRSTEDLSGLPQAFIGSLYRDPAVIRMMTMEARLRAADLGRLSSNEALFMLLEAAAMLAEYEAEPTATVDYRLGLSSFAIQVSLYFARVEKLGDKVRHDHLLRVRQYAQAVEGDTRSALGLMADRGHAYQAARIEINALHAESMLVPICSRLGIADPTTPLIRSKLSVARRLVTDPDIYSGILHVTREFGDPRTPINPAEGAGLIGQHHRAKSLLLASMEVAGYRGKIRDWNPFWLPENYLTQVPELQEAIQLIDGPTN